MLKAGLSKWRLRCRWRASPVRAPPPVTICAQEKKIWRVMKASFTPLRWKARLQDARDDSVYMTFLAPCLDAPPRLVIICIYAYNAPRKRFNTDSLRLHFWAPYSCASAQLTYELGASSLVARQCVTKKISFHRYLPSSLFHLPKR